MKLTTVMLGSEDAPRLAAYYTRLFGEPGWAEGGYTGWQIGSGMLMIGPHDQVHGSNQEPGRIIWNLESEDFRSDYERLTAAGATVVREPYKPGEGDEMWLATFSDPDGNYFQLATQM